METSHRCGNKCLNRPLWALFVHLIPLNFRSTVNSQWYQQNTPLASTSVNTTDLDLYVKIRFTLGPPPQFTPSLCALQWRLPSPSKGSSSVLNLFRSRSISVNPPPPCWWKSAAIWSKVLPRVSGTRKNVKMRKNRSSAAKIRNTYGPQRFWGWKQQRHDPGQSWRPGLRKNTYSYILEAHANYEVGSPVTKASHGHGCRPGTLGEQLSHKEPGDGAWADLEEGHKAIDGQHADVAHPGNTVLSGRRTQTFTHREKTHYAGIVVRRTSSARAMVMMMAHAHMPPSPIMWSVRRPIRSIRNSC